MPVLTSQQESDALAKLNLGTSSEILNNSPDSPLASLLKDLMQSVVDALGESLDKYGIRASGKLKQTMLPNSPVLEGSNLTVSISAEFYWKFMNYGVNGFEVSHGAPEWGKVETPELSYKESVLNWIRDKGISLPEGFSSYDSFAYSIMTNKAKYGQEPRPFFTDVVNERIVDVLKIPIEKLIGQAIKVNIVEPWQ